MFSFRVFFSTKRFLGVCAAASSLASRITPSSSKGVAAALLFNSPSHTTLLTQRFMSDEVEKAQEAAVAYQASDKDGAGPATVFDKILSKEWKSEKVYEDDTVYAFRDINPQAPTHIIVIPKERDGLTKLSNARPDQEGLLGHLLFVSQKIGNDECPEGFRLVINDGKDGAQSVYHLHIHILGGRQMTWPPG